MIPLPQACRVFGSFAFRFNGVPVIYDGPVHQKVLSQLELTGKKLQDVAITFFGPYEEETTLCRSSMDAEDLFTLVPREEHRAQRKIEPSRVSWLGTISPEMKKIASVILFAIGLLCLI